MAALIQSTKGRLKPAIAVMVILLSVLSLFILDGLLVYMYNRGVISSTVANIIIAAYAIVLFLTLLVKYSISSVYALDGVKITFSRVYLKNPRLEEQIMLREVVYFGDFDSIDGKYDIKRKRNFAAKRGDLHTMALVYKREKKYRCILFSPNEQISQGLRESLKL